MTVCDSMDKKSNYENKIKQYALYRTKEEFLGGFRQCNFTFINISTKFMFINVNLFTPYMPVVPNLSNIATHFRTSNQEATPIIKISYIHLFFL